MTRHRTPGPSDALLSPGADGSPGVSHPRSEALQRLERTGLVEISPNRYTRVSMPDLALLKETHEFVVLMLGNIVRCAVARGADEMLERALDELEVLIAASRGDDRVGIMDGSARVFASLTHASGNRAFVRVMREAYEPLRDAIVARDGDAAELALRAQHGLD